MKIISLKPDEIKVANRSREQIGDLTSLKFSIGKYGLLNPILIDEDYNLIAGERRLKACKDLLEEGFLEYIPVRVMPNISQDDALLIERIENVDRKEFEWAEEIELKLRIHEYYAERNSKWNYRRTCEVLGVSLGGLSSDLELAKAIRNFPSLAESSTKRAAQDLYKKLIQKAEAVSALESLPEDQRSKLEAMLEGKEAPEKEESSEEAAAAEAAPLLEVQDFSEEEPSFDSVASAVELKRSVQYVYQISTWQKLLERIPDGTIGFCEIDPPYAINYESIYASNSNQNDADWKFEDLQNNLSELFESLRPKLLPDAWLLVWTAWEHADWINRMAAGFDYHIQRPGIWVKPGGTANRVDKQRISNYETNLLIRHGDASFNTPKVHAAVTFASVPAARKYHQWQKPLELYQYFFDALGREGSVFFSPFAGSGMSMVAAALNGMIPMGSDISKKYFYQFYQTLQEYVNAEEQSPEELEPR